MFILVVKLQHPFPPTWHSFSMELVNTTSTKFNIVPWNVRNLDDLLVSSLCDLIFLLKRQSIELPFYLVDIGHL